MRSSRRASNLARSRPDAEGQPNSCIGRDTNIPSHSLWLNREAGQHLPDAAGNVSAAGWR